MLIALRIVFFLISAPAIFLAIFLFAIFSNQATLAVPASLGVQDLKAAQSLFKQLKANSANVETLELTSAQLNSGLNYFVNRYVDSAVAVNLMENNIALQLSFLLPDNDFGRHLNLSFQLKHENGLFIIKQLQLGKVLLADEFAATLLKKLLKYSPLKHYYHLAIEHILAVQISPASIRIDYTGKTDVAPDMSSLNSEQQALWFYRQKIAEIIETHDPAWRLSLAELLQPLFQIAYQRSNLDTAIAENKIVIAAVSRYINQTELESYLPLPKKRLFEVFLYKRVDMAKHFMNSALLSATGNNNLAYLLGEEKEFRDAKQGSGFSFIDLAGDRAGMRFGDVATANAESARRLQQMMSVIQDYRAFMPDVSDLPENISNAQFDSNYGTVYSTAYQAVLQKIDNRIAALPIYQNF